MKKFGLIALAVGLLSPLLALAHYPWFSADSVKGSKNVIFVFEDGIAPGTGEYLDPFIKNGNFSLRTPGKKESIALKFADTKKNNTRWLTFPFDQGGPRAIDCYCKWGVYQGKLLLYYARYLDVSSAEELAGLARSETMKFDLVPKVANDAMEIQVFWEGKPASARTISIFGPKFNMTVTSDDNGVARFKPGERGLYRLRTQFIQPDPAGKENGVAYKGLRQTATMSIQLPIASAK